MGALNEEALRIRNEINLVKARIQKYRMILIWSIYSGGVFLILEIGLILFPPEGAGWSSFSNLIFIVLLLNLWGSYRIIGLIRKNQALGGRLRIKLRQMVWDKVCDCKEPCGCSVKLEQELNEELNSWNEGVFAEAGNETKLS